MFSFMQGDIRNTVAVLYDKLQEIWFHKRFSDDHVKSRYLGTHDGILMRFPGKRLPHDYDHTTQPWYLTDSILYFDSF